MATAKLTRSMTYAELVTAIQNSALHKGESITITDFQTRHYLLDGTQRYTNASYLYEVNSGAVEPLTVKALSVNTLDRQVRSTIYPKDIIYYDWNYNNWSEDISTVDNSQFKGVIYYREDTLNNNSLGYDFRNVKFRRWKTNYPVWDAETSYSKIQKVQKFGCGLYLSLTDANMGNDPSMDELGEFWIKVLDYTSSDYWCIMSTDALDENDYTDLPTFAENGTYATYDWCVKGNHLAPFRTIYDEYGNPSSCYLGNNVFYLSGSGGHSCEQLSGCWFNTQYL